MANATLEIRFTTSLKVSPSAIALATQYLLNSRHHLGHHVHHRTLPSSPSPLSTNLAAADET